MAKLNDDYLAGFIDGEGCLSICKFKHHGRENSVYYRPLLHIGNTNRVVLEAVREYLDAGWVCSLASRNGRRKESYQYQLTGRTHLLPLLVRLRARLIVKQRQADILIEFMSGLRAANNRRQLLSVQENTSREAMLAQIRDLNRRGSVSWL